MSKAVKKEISKRSARTQRLVSKVRQSTGLSVAQIGQLVGVDRQTVWRWQGGGSARDQHLADLRTILAEPVAAGELAARAKRGLLHLGSVSGLLSDLNVRDLKPKS